jgi:hypothetical protein
VGRNDPDHDAVLRIGSESSEAGGPILHNGMKAMGFAGSRHLEPSSAIPHRGADRAETVSKVPQLPDISVRRSAELLGGSRWIEKIVGSLLLHRAKICFRLFAVLSLLRSFYFCFTPFAFFFFAFRFFRRNNFFFALDRVARHGTHYVRIPTIDEVCGLL